MSRPNNSIGKIKLPGENVERPIIPYALGYSSSNGYQATLPVLTVDDFIVTTKTAQDITGTKTFSQINFDSDMNYVNKYGIHMSDGDGGWNHFYFMTNDYMEAPSFDKLQIYLSHIESGYLSVVANDPTSLVNKEYVDNLIEIVNLINVSN